MFGLDLGRLGSPGGVGIRQLLGLPTFDATGKLVPGVWLDGRVVDVTLPDLDAIDRDIPAPYLAYSGGRNVQNNITDSEYIRHVGGGSGQWNLNNATLTQNVADPDGGTSAVTLTATSTDGQIDQYNPWTNGNEASNSVWVRRRTGTGQIQIHEGGSTLGWRNVTISSTWQRICPIVGIARTSTVNYIGVRCRISGDAVDFWHPQQEDVTDQVIQTPDGYQKVDDITYNGFAIYNTVNANTIASQVVTEIQGAAISPAPLWTSTADTEYYCLAAGNINLAKTTATVVFTAPDASTALGTPEDILAVDGTAFLSFGATDGLFTLTDGTNSVSLTQTWNANDKLAVGVSADASTSSMVLHVRNITQDNTQHSAATTFDGALGSGTNLELLNGCSHSFYIHDVPVWSLAKSNADWELDHAT